jgi:hypothetical protein
LLEKEQIRKVQQLRRKQQPAEMRSNQISAAIAKFMSTWLEQFPLHPPDKLSIVQAAERRSWHSHVTAGVDSAISKINSVVERSRPRREEPSFAPELMEWILEWLLNWLLLLEPDREIRDRAFKPVLRDLYRKSPGW